MTRALEELVGKLAARLPELRRERFSSTFANDVFESVEYWRNLGQYVLDRNTKVNYPERARHELTLLLRLEAVLKESPEVRPKYAQLLSASGELLRNVEKVQPPKNGHLGTLKFIAKYFSFLQTEYNFAIVDKQPTGVRFSSRAVHLKLECIENPHLSCSFGPEADPKETFWINDLLFMNGDPRYRTLPEELQLDTEVQVDGWFAFLGGVFRQYGQPVLGNEPEIFQRLARAQAERDHEYVEEMNRKFDTQGNGS
jgi:hypothetical protein